MNTLIKVFLIYASVSMTTAFILMMLTMTDVVSYRTIPMGIVMALWMGPLALATAIVGPIVMWYIWKIDN